MAPQQIEASTQQSGVSHLGVRDNKVIIESSMRPVMDLGLGGPEARLKRGPSD